MATSAKDSRTSPAPKPAPRRRKDAAAPKAKAKPRTAEPKPAVEAPKAVAIEAKPVQAPAEAKAPTSASSPPVAKSAAAKAAVAKATPAKPVARKAPAPRAATAKASGSGIGAGTVIGVAAAGLAAGIVANLGRKAAVQAPSVMAGDWMEALKAEHKAALALIDQIGRTTPQQKAKRTLLLTQLKHALGKHAFTEENVIYPALREWGDKADADALNHEQGYHKQFLYELEGLDRASPAFDAKIADFRADLESHIREEEDKIFPQLHAGLSADKNKALTALANREGFKMA